MRKDGIAPAVSRRLLLRLSRLGAGSALLGGLGRRAASAAGNPVADAIDWAQANLPNSTPAMIEAAAKEGRLTLTMQQLGDDSFKAMVDGFNRRYPFIDVAFTTQTVGQILNKFNAELSARRGISDYIQLPSNLQDIAAYERSGSVANFVISQDAAYPARAKHGGSWYAWLQQHGISIYRPDMLSAEEKQLVRTFAGLGDPRFKGRIALNDATNASSVTGCYVLLYGSDPAVWQRLVANQPKVKPSTPAVMDSVLSGEADVGLFCGIASPTSAAQQGGPIEFGITSPSPTLYTPGSVSALAPHPNAARLWQDWAMSREGQELWCAKSGTVSARTDVTARTWAETQPWFFEDRSAEQAIDWDDFTKRQADVVARFKRDLRSA